MQRTILIALVTAVLAAGISAGATILLTDDDDPLSIATPIATASPVESVDVSTPPASPGTTDDGVQPAPAPGGSTASPAADGNDGDDEGSGAPAIRSASSVDCDDEPKRCSPTHDVRVSDDRVDGDLSDSDPPDYSGVPTITMTSELREKDDGKASDGEEIGAIFVEVVVENKTNETFVFAKREVALDVYRDGERVQTLVTEGDGFNLTPGGKMNATFDRPIAMDGHYEWQAKIWYYAK